MSDCGCDTTSSTWSVNRNDNNNDDNLSTIIPIENWTVHHDGNNDGDRATTRRNKRRKGLVGSMTMRVLPFAMFMTILVLSSWCEIVVQSFTVVPPCSSVGGGSIRNILATTSKIESTKHTINRRNLLTAYYHPNTNPMISSLSSSSSLLCSTSSSSTVEEEESALVSSNSQPPKHNNNHHHEQPHEHSTNITTSAATIPTSNTNDSTITTSSTTSTGTAAAKATSALSKSIKPILKPLGSTLLIMMMDFGLKKLFLHHKIQFPSSLAGCGLLFFTMISFGGATIQSLVQPGATLLAKWLPVMFVPALVTLPLSPRLGNSMEIFKIMTVLSGGFVFSMLSTSWSVLLIRKLSSAGSTRTTSPEKATTSVEKATTTTPVTTTNTTTNNRPFSKPLLNTLGMISISSLLLNSVIGSKSKLLTSLTTTLCLLSTALGSFVLGARLPSKVTKIIHPLVTCTSLTWVMSYLLGIIQGISFTSVLRLYKTGSLPGGAGDLLSYMLGPAVVSLASQMYSRLQLIKQNWKEVFGSVLVSSIGGLFGTAYLVKFLHLSSQTIRLSLLSRNITSPLAMAIANMLSFSETAAAADPSLAVAFVVLSGLLGANFGSSILTKFGIGDPVARGLGMGASAHGLGTAALSSSEQEAFPFGAISMALTASLSTVLVSIPQIRNILMTISLG